MKQNLIAKSLIAGTGASENDAARLTLEAIEGLGELTTGVSHTFATYHAAMFRNLPELQPEMGAGINASEVAGPDNADIIIADYQDGDVLNTGHQYIVGAAADTKVTVVNAKGETFNNVSIATVPEPTTATLSLPALAALAARRRRK